jgi:hypothetical protein
MTRCSGSPSTVLRLVHQAPIDLLEDATVESFAARLQSHPTVEVTCTHARHPPARRSRSLPGSSTFLYLGVILDANSPLIFPPGTFERGYVTSYRVNISAQRGNSPYSRYKSSYCFYKNPLAGRNLVARLHKSRAVSDRRLVAP